jgi:ketosteroid isomerase-like protein
MNLLMKSLAKTLFLIPVFSIVMFFTYPTYGEELSAAQKEVWKMQEAVWELWKKGEVEGRLALYHKECILWLYNAAFPGDKTLIRREMTKYSKIDSFELEPQEVKVFGNFAIVQYSLKYTAFGKNYNERATTNWMKQDEKWQIIGSMRAQQPSEFPK